MSNVLLLRNEGFEVSKNDRAAVTVSKFPQNRLPCSVFSPDLVTTSIWDTCPYSAGAFAVMTLASLNASTDAETPFKEAKVITANAPAEYGQVSQIEVVTKS